MQKTVRINLLARNSAAKHFQKIKHRDTKNEWKQWHQATNQIKGTQGKYVREERLHRRQDWTAGPLAPNRNAGTNKGTFGTSDTEFFQLPRVPDSVRAAPKKEGFAAISEEELARNGFRGDTIVGNVVVNDRVVIVAGPDRLRGLIGNVSDVDNDKETVKLTNVNTADIAIPAYAQPPASEANPNPARYTSLDLPIPMSHVRIVSTITDENGQQRDVIFRHVHGGPPYLQRPLGSHLPSHTRYVTGGLNDQDVEIPWPEDLIMDDFVYHEGDTTRTAVQMNSWTPSIDNAPLGYLAEVPNTVDTKDDSYSRSQELFEIDVKGPSGLSNLQRAGLNGFIDADKLAVRQKRIADGIMSEFRTKHKELNTRHDDVDWVKRKMIEDARAIWYQERKLASPASQAAELAVQKRAEARQAEAEKATKKVRKLQETVLQLRTEQRESDRRAVMPRKRAVPRPTWKAIEELKLPIKQRVGFVPDAKLVKKLLQEKKRLAAT